MIRSTPWAPPLPFRQIGITNHANTPPAETTRTMTVDSTLTSRLRMHETGVWKGVMLSEAAKTNGIMLLDMDETETPPSDSIIDIDADTMATRPTIAVKRRDGTVETWTTRVLITSPRHAKPHLLDLPDEVEIRIDHERRPTIGALAQMIFDICDRPTACGTYDIDRAIECAYMTAYQALHGREKAYEWIIETTLRKMASRWGRPTRTYQIHLGPGTKKSTDIRISETGTAKNDVVQEEKTATH